MKIDKTTDTLSSVEKGSDSGSRRKSISGFANEVAPKSISNNFSSSRVQKKFSSSFSISSLLAASKNKDNLNQLLQQKEEPQKHNSEASPPMKTEVSEEMEPLSSQKMENVTLKEFKDSSLQQNDFEEDKKKKKMDEKMIPHPADVVQPLSVDPLPKTVCSTKSAAFDVHLESLKSITTCAASTYNNLLIPVSSLPTNIIAALPLPESVRKSLNATEPSQEEIFSEKGKEETTFDDISPKKEKERGIHSSFSLDKFGEILGNKNGANAGKGKERKSDFEDDEEAEVEGARLSSDSDNSNEEDDDEDGEFEEDGSGGRKKKTRTVFSRTQVGQLETMFDLKRYLSSSERSSLARDLGLSEQQIKIWFQNRRNKLKRQIKTGLEMAGNISAGTVPPPNVNAALLDSHSLSIGPISGTGLSGHHHPHGFLSSSFNMSSLFPTGPNTTPTGVSGTRPVAGLSTLPSVTTAGHALGNASLMSSMLPGMNFHSNPVNTFNQHVNNHFFHRPPIASSFGSSTANSLLSPPSANQSAALFSTNQSISITPFPSSSSTHNSSQTNPSQNNFSYPNLPLFKSLSGFV